MRWGLVLRVRVWVVRIIIVAVVNVRVEIVVHVEKVVGKVRGRV